MKLKLIKTHKDAKLPSQNNKTSNGTSDTGYDLYAVEDTIVPYAVTQFKYCDDWYGVRAGSAVVPVGLEVAYIEPGYWFRIEARSGMGFKHGIQPHPGIIDNQYRGDLGIKLYNLTEKEYVVKAGDKIAQIVAYPLIEMNVEFVDKKEKTVRGEKGFGSSGK